LSSSTLVVSVLTNFLTIEEQMDSKRKATRKRELTPSRNIDIRPGQMIADGDRYVGIRTEEQLAISQHLIRSEESSILHRSSSAPCSPDKQAERDMKMKLMRAKSVTDMDGTSTSDFRIVAYRRGLAPRPPVGYRSKPAVAYSCIQPSNSVKRTQRYMPKSPQRILDAPTIRDDYYLNLLDWGHCNTVAVALDNVVYLWNAESGDVSQLDEFTVPLYVSSVKWSLEGKYLSVGLSDGSLRLYDPRQKKLLRTLLTHGQRVGAIAWRKNVVSSGNRNGNIYHHDVRVRDSLVGTFSCHRGEVCGLKWSPDERQITSGSADNTVKVWNESQVNSEGASPIFTFIDHSAAVKAVEYVPFLGGLNCNMVATGGGTGDNTVKIWNLSNGTLHSSTDTENKVSSILFNKQYREMCVAQAGPQNIVRFYDYNPTDKFRLISDLEGHTARILSLAQSPCGQYIMSASSDESLRLWQCWKMDKSVKAAQAPMNKLTVESLR